MGVVVDEEDLQQFFAQYDSNGNGRLDYKEFADVAFGRKKASGSQASAAS
jgi:Ca2+-binding EF-hand superfamily protein